jgi:phosphatidylglycerophosphate synthase
MTSFAANLRLLPNQLTAARLLLLPGLWSAALLGQARTVGIGLALSFLLDWGDGYVARRWSLTSAFGSRFDSLVDALIGPSAVAWLLLLEPAALLDHRWVTLTWFALTYMSLVLGLVKFRRVANLHLRSSRIACVAQYAFGVDALLAPPYQPGLFYAAAVLGIVSSLETLVLQLVRSSVHERHGSLLRAIRQES